jgi:hypothetical protein
MAAKIRRGPTPLGSFKDIAFSDLDPLDPAHRDLVRREVLKVGGLLAALEHSAGVSPSLRIEEAPFKDSTPSPAPGTSVIRMERRKGKNAPLPTRPTVDPVTFHKGSWNDTVWTILNEAGRPIPYAELREKLLKTHLADKLGDDGRVYYCTVMKLKQLGLCKSYKGLIGTPENITKFEAEVAAGRAADVRVARYRNKVAEAMLVFLEDRETPASFREIIENLETVFNKKSDRSWEAYVNIVLRRMVSESKRVVKVKKGIYKIRDDSNGAGASEKERTTEDLLSVARH